MLLSVQALNGARYKSNRNQRPIGNRAARGSIPGFTFNFLVCIRNRAGGRPCGRLARADRCSFESKAGVTASLAQQHPWVAVIGPQARPLFGVAPRVSNYRQPM